jgi:AraC family transcriptional regulator of adaptative response/methylated-DNA-[protein]-cysteine methyltransferase
MGAGETSRYVRVVTRRSPTDDDRWEAVLGRDAAADGAFVYAVTSTRVFCRPSCAARRPRREHVVFFASPADAQAAGYRSCRRCAPDQVSRQVAAVAAACALLDEAEEMPTLASLGEQVGMSPHHLQRVFTRIVGVSPRRYGAARRMERARGALRNAPTVTDALYQAGYGSSRAFYEDAADRLGMAPSHYRAGAVDAAVAFTIAASSLGRLLVAATPRGVCAVRFGDDDVALEAALADEFPRATVTRDDDGLGAVVRAVLDHLDGNEPHLDLPLDVRATAFQWQVWEALRAIPAGEVRTYAEVAGAIGRPSAARAVAGACAANPVAVLVPCHRVVPANAGGVGGVGGYRWGPERKRRLLEGEAARGVTSRSSGVRL